MSIPMPTDTTQPPAPAAAALTQPERLTWTPWAYEAIAGERRFYVEAATRTDEWIAYRDPEPGMHLEYLSPDGQWSETPSYHESAEAAMAAVAAARDAGAQQ